MVLIANIENSIWTQFSSYKNVLHYIKKWQVVEEDWNNTYSNFRIEEGLNGQIDLMSTLHNIDGETLLKMAIDLGVETPDFIPSIPVFRNEIKSMFETANATFEKAYKQIEEHPDIAIGLVNSALESIIKEILKDERITTKPNEGETLYGLAQNLLKEFQLFPSSELPIEIKTIGSSILSASKAIEKLRSEKTNFHGKTNGDYFIEDPMFAYFVVNSVITVGLFLNSFYKRKFPKITNENEPEEFELPF
ncbi:abortive infection C-terminus [Bacteroidales bacterium 6E]|nr:abortive infection C-terminus [Bacteroidales bacterium 6E]